MMMEGGRKECKYTDLALLAFFSVVASSSNLSTSIRLQK